MRYRCAALWEENVNVFCCPFCFLFRSRGTHDYGAAFRDAGKCGIEQIARMTDIALINDPKNEKRMTKAFACTSARRDPSEVLLAAPSSDHTRLSIHGIAPLCVREASRCKRVHLLSLAVTLEPCLSEPCCAFLIGVVVLSDTQDGRV